LIKLMKDEKILEVVSPHPISFWPHYLFFLYYIVVSICFYSWWYESIYNTIQSETGSDFIATILIVAIWWIVMIAPSVIFFLIEITAKWLIMFALIAVAGTVGLIKGVIIDPKHIWIISLSVGILGFILTEFDRRAHKFIITNKRLVMGVYMGIFGTKERELLYSNIVDVVLNQGFLGKLLNFGTIIPTTPSGLGTGADTAQIAVGAGVGVGKEGAGVGAGVSVGGGRGVVVPRGRSWFVLYGVPDPERIRDMIFEQVQKRESAQYLQRQVELLEELVEEKKKGE